jgi:hypothetical protein
MMLQISSIVEGLSAGSGISFPVDPSLDWPSLKLGPNILENGFEAMQRRRDDAEIRT